MNPRPPTEFPSVFNGHGMRMLDTKIAVWSPVKSDYQVYQVQREDWPAIRLIPINSERTSRFYFSEGQGDTQSRTFTLHRPRARIHSHTDMAIWHTGGWLCKNHHNRMVPVLPILTVSDPGKLQWVGNVGLHRETAEFRDWVHFQTPFFYRPIIHNRILPRPTSRWEDEKEPAPPTDPIPLFVAEALLEKAIAAEETCPISLEPLEKGAAAVTSCFHTFQAAALEEWCSKQTTCPVCKKTCAVTKC